MRIGTQVLAWCLLVGGGFAQAQTTTPLVEVRPGVHVGLHWMRHEPGPAKGVVALLPGGGGGLALGADGEPQNQNFLIRSRQLFYDQGYDVVSIGNPEDHVSLAPQYRTSREHVGDLEAVVQFIRTQTGAPVWLVGTSRGTTSAAAGAVRFGHRLLAGLVLSSSISTSRSGGSVLSENLADIDIPVLLVHHADDDCNATPPLGAEAIRRALVKAPVKLVFETGGTASGAECGPFHYHGYEGIEAKTVQDITAWMARPTAQ